MQIITAPFGYKQVVPFLKTQKVRLLAPGEVPEFAQRGHAIPISYTEFQAAAHDYPIVFISTDSKEFIAVAVLGLVPDENLFFADGAWASGLYIPAYARRFPFCMSTIRMNNVPQKDRLICVEKSHVDEKGEALFDPAGEPSAKWQTLERLLSEYEADLDRSREMCAILADYGLYEPFTMEAKLHQEGAAPMKIQGMYRIAERSLENLNAAQLKNLMRKGIFARVYLHLLSLVNFGRLLDRKAARGTAAVVRNMAHSRDEWRSLMDAGSRFERAGEYRAAWSCLADAGNLQKPPVLAQWMGEPLAGKHLLVQRCIRHTGAELRMARFLSLAAEEGAQVTAFVESRLAPLLARSFPSVRVQDEASFKHETTGNLFASYERLAQWLGPDQRSIEAGFRPLVASPQRVALLRGAGPQRGVRIGLAWHSVNKRKALPRLSDWAALLGGLPEACWVSLQYQEQDAGLAELAAAAKVDIQDAAGLDQIADLDGFAAQVASVDAVVTISNTTAHMAGAMGVPTLVLLDDLDQLTWPSTGPTTPFFPKLRLVRKSGRPWPETMLELRESLAQMLPALTD